MVEHYAKNSVYMEIIDVVYDAPFLVGNMFKYMVRTGDKGADDRMKAIDYANRFLSIIHIDERLLNQTTLWFAQKRNLLVRFDPIFVEKGYPSISEETWLPHYISELSKLP